ncbi:uncharacterized protein LOC108744980 [Agrilus planipennis]|uniref:Uncharacterized protein LOC108744980 n=1 Tax=Agrilus planipennis TaxID=224129 RepID=A0A1W4XKH4_AGRPL|nr:uncharacterized protein LOC108744980 [Agrilus planipennis]
MFNQLSAIVFVALISLSCSQYTSRGQCNGRDRSYVSAVQFFNLERFARNGAPWYPVISYSNDNGDCQTVSFTVTGSRTMDVVYTNKNLATGISSTKEAKVTWQPVSYLSAVLRLDSSDLADSLVFKVIGMVYDEFTIIYRCVDLDKQNRQEFLYVMGRNSSLTSAQQASVNQILEARNLNGTQVNIIQDSTICSS